MATLAELRQDVLDMLGEDGFGDIRGEQVERWLNEAADIAAERALNRQAESTAVTAAQQDSYLLPDDVLMLNAVFWSDKRLPQVPIGQFRRRQERGTADGPVYAHWQGAIYLHPAPTRSGDVIRLYYLRSPQRMTNAGDLPDLQRTLHHMLKAYALEQAYLKRQNPQMAQYWTLKWEQSIIHLRRRYGPQFSDYWDTMEVER